MEMTKKQILVAAAATVLGCLIFVYLFAMPVSGKLNSVTVSSFSESAYNDTVVPYYLDPFSENYIEDVDHFIEDYSASDLPEDYREIYIVFDAKKYTPVPFRSLWVDVESIPEKYRDTVVCVSNAPLMTEGEKSSSQGNITLIVKSDKYTDEELEKMAKELSYSIKWTLAMGIDGYIHI